MEIIRLIGKVFAEHGCETIKIETDKAALLGFPDDRKFTSLPDIKFASDDLKKLLSEIAPGNNQDFISGKKPFQFNFPGKHGEFYSIDVTFLNELPVLTFRILSDRKEKSIKLSGSFPAKVPSALSSSESAQNIKSSIIGFCISLFIFVICFVGLQRNSLIGKILDPFEPTALIPFAIFWLFFWGVAILAYRLQRIKKIEITSPKSLLFEATSLLQTLGPIGLSNDLTGEIVVKIPLLYRLQAVLRQWLIHPSVQDANLILEQHAAFEEEKMNSSYGLLRTFIWALPVLGLIGTVLGIFFAVGGFARFLGGSIEDIAVIKSKLVDVTGGLSYAFLITLLGLLPSLILMLVTSIVQMREEKFYSTIDFEIANHFIPVLQKISPDNEPSNQSLQTDFKETYREIFQRQAEFRNDLVNDLSKIGDGFEETSEKFTREIRSFTSTVVDGMKTSLTSNDKTLEDIRVTTKSLIDHFNSSLDNSSKILAQNLEKSNQKIINLSSEFQTNMIAAEKTMAHFENVTQNFNVSVTQFSDSIRALMQTNNVSSDAITAVNRHSDLLEKIQKDQEQIGQLLKNLSKPMEFRIVTPKQE